MRKVIDYGATKSLIATEQAFHKYMYGLFLEEIPNNDYNETNEYNKLGKID